MRRSPSTYDGYILDVDGTLYDQRRVRLAMLCRLASHYLRHPLQLREGLALYRFRRLREMPAWKDSSFDELFAELEKSVRLPAARCAQVIRYWMFQVPLDLLESFAYRDVISFVNGEHGRGKRVIVYSDYPAEEKLDVLGLCCDSMYVFGRGGVDEQKPSPRVMERILRETALAPDGLLYVGDRDEKDGASAKLAGTDYCDIRAFRKLLR